MANPGPTITFSMFFDRQGVLAAVDKARLKVLRWQGGTVRKIARTSIKRMGKARPRPRRWDAQVRWWQEVLNTPASPPGSPPYTHTGFLREDIAFGYDKATRSTVVGPWMSNWLGRLHEFGLAKRVLLTRHPVRRGQPRRYALKRYPKRSYMHPALDTAMESLPRSWEGAIVPV
jgi:hypothetical protein